MSKIKSVQLLGGSKDGMKMEIPAGTVHIDEIVVADTGEKYEPQTELERLTGVWTLVVKK